ncbi:hypothetical protein A2U01_0007413 [Trifolium medium]|uniref:Uncharacterized protein n=1 Tax=Trifolium medium TaxID=97028 RepID=A0A392MHI2_9FABA|nr:hypothetical protein [Trifolium medium]
MATPPQTKSPATIAKSELVKSFLAFILLSFILNAQVMQYHLDATAAAPPKASAAPSAAASAAASAAEHSKSLSSLLHENSLALSFAIFTINIVILSCIVTVSIFNQGGIVLNVLLCCKLP